MFGCFDFDWFVVVLCVVVVKYVLVWVWFGCVSLIVWMLYWEVFDCVDYFVVEIIDEFIGEVCSCFYVWVFELY